MTIGRRIAVAAVAACLASLLMFASAVSAPGGTPIESYRAAGEARGLDVAFTFDNSIFERLVDIGLPAARSDLNSEAGGAARGVAAQLYPGDLVVGQAGEQLPFYRQAVYPPTVADPKPVDEAHTTDVFQLPGVIAAGPLLAAENSYLKATASADESSGLVTTSRVALGFISIRHLETKSEGHRSADRVTHFARSVARDIAIVVSPEVTVKIGAVISEVATSSDGESPTAKSKLTVSDVFVEMSGQRYGATIDQSGITLDGASEPIPGVIGQSLTQKFDFALTNAGIHIATAETAPKMEDVTGDASLGGLVIRVTGSVPYIFTPQIVNDVIYQMVVPNLPEEVRYYIEHSVCLKRDVFPRLPEQLVENLPDLPLCFSPNVVPGPGSGGIATFAIGSVRSLSAAVQEVSFGAPPPVGGDDGGFLPPVLGGAVPPIDGGVVPPAVVPPVAPTQPQQRYGLVAKMPSEALLGSGLALLVLALGVALGPSLRRWRVTQEP